MFMRTSSDYIMTLPYATLFDRARADAVIDMIRESKKQKPRTQLRNVYVRETNRYEVREVSGRWILRVHARLGKNSPYRDKYASGNGAAPRGEYYRRAWPDIKRVHGDRLDIYLNFQPN
jgi:hypothetical protein